MLEMITLHTSHGHVLVHKYDVQSPYIAASMDNNERNTANQFVIHGHSI